MRHGAPVRIALLITLSGSAMPAQTLLCPLAPRQGPVCQYVDQQRLQALVHEAIAESGRWAILQTSIPAIQRLVDRTREGAEGLHAFDSTLRRIKTPRAAVSAVFAAAWNLAHPTASIRVVSAGGGVKVLNAAALSDSAVRALQDARDPATRTAADLESLARATPGNRTAGALAAQLGRLYATARSAADTNRALVTAANRLGARTRANFTGMAGESEAHILAAKGALDLMRGLAETQRLDGTEAALTSVRSAQQARQLKERALLDLGRFGRGNP